MRLRSKGLRPSQPPWWRLCAAASWAIEPEPQPAGLRRWRPRAKPGPDDMIGALGHMVTALRGHAARSRARQRLGYVEMIAANQRHRPLGPRREHADRAADRSRPAGRGPRGAGRQPRRASPLLLRAEGTEPIDLPARSGEGRGGGRRSAPPRSCARRKDPPGIRRSRSAPRSRTYPRSCRRAPQSPRQPRALFRLAHSISFTAPTCRGASGGG